MSFDFDSVINRYDSICVKYNSAREKGYPPDIIPMWVADMDFQSPPCVINALRKAVDHGIFGYSSPKEGYYSAICNWFRDRFDWQMEKEWIVQTGGVVFALSTAVRALTAPGDAAMILTPVYPPFYSVVQKNGRKLVESSLLLENEKYTIDFADVEQKIRANGVRMFILCSPHNPIGRVWTPEELQTLGAICKKYDVAVVSDEIHCDYTMPGHPHTPFIKACPEWAENTMVCTAPSKTFNLAGLEASNIFIPGEQMRKAYREELGRIFGGGLNCMGIIGCQAAYEGGAQWLDACKEYIRGNLAYVREFLRDNLPQVKLIEPEGTYFAWLDFTELGMTREQLDEMIVYKAKLWLDTGSMFGDAAAQFQRVVLGCPRSIVVRAMQQLRAAVCD